MERTQATMWHPDSNKKNSGESSPVFNSLSGLSTGEFSLNDKAAKRQIADCSCDLATGSSGRTSAEVDIRTYGCNV